MTTMVTGGGGFVGGRLVRRLVEEGEQVRALVRSPDDAARLRALGVEVVSGDLADLTAIRRSIDGCRHVFHLAAATSWGRRARDLRAVNRDGTDAVARAALEVAVDRFVYVSTTGVYGTPRGGLLDEASTPAPNTRYRDTKLEGERVCLALRSSSGLPVVIARLAPVTGRGSIAWLGYCRAIAEGRLRLIGDGSNRIHTIDIEDAVQGLRRCAEAPVESLGQPFLLAAEKPMALASLLELIAGETGSRPPGRSLPEMPFRAFRRLASLIYSAFGVEVPGSTRYDLFLADRRFRIDRARSELGFEPGVDMPESFRGMIGWSRETGRLG
jgi:nucleoside-diphosphate-sugar epimerase